MLHRGGAECISGYSSSDGVESTFDNQQPQPNPHLMKRRMSRSEPTLDLPKFHIGGGHLTVDNDPIMTRVLSGLFESDSAYHTPYNLSTSDLRMAGETTSSATTAAGSFLSPNVGSSIVPPLRKSSSAVEWSSAANNVPTAGQQMSTSSVGGANLMSAKSSSTIAADVSSNKKSLTAAVAAAVQSSQHDHHNHHNSGGMFNMFSRGFLAKPVVRSEEETYRYLMALDR